MSAYFVRKLIAVILTISIVVPFPYVLVLPEYAFAAGPQQGGGGGGASSWSQAAASGLVSLAGCLLSGSSLLGGFFGNINWSQFSISSILGGGSGGAAGAVPAAATGAIGGAVATEVPGVAQEVPVKDKSVVEELKTVQKNQEKQMDMQKKQLNLQLGAMQKKDVLDCIGWALAKLIWRQIAGSIVDWINGGFNGKPAFLQDFNKFMLGVGDQIAGQIIQGSALSFLCSPFSLNIRIALATRYSQRAPSCTLTQVIKNVQNFMNNFSQGGWSSWLQLTTVPQNNNYGGYLIGAATVQLNIDKQQLSWDKQLKFGSGFLPATSQKCQGTSVNAGGKSPSPQASSNCSSSVDTPGALIANKIGATINSPETSLLLADDLNKIIDALSQQLITKALSGFNSLSQSNSYSDDYSRFMTSGSGLDGSTTNLDGTAISTTTGDIFNNTFNNVPFVYRSSGSAPFTAGFYVSSPLTDGTVYGVSFGDGQTTATWPGPCSTTDGTTCISTTHTYAKPGIYTAQLSSLPASTCPDGAVCAIPTSNIISTATIVVTGSTNQNLTATPYTGQASLIVQFQTPSAPPGTYNIDYGDGSVPEQTTVLTPCPTGAACINGVQPLPVHTYNAGAYTAQLLGADGQAIGSVTIAVSSNTAGGGATDGSGLVNQINKSIQTEQTIQTRLGEGENMIASAELSVDALISCWNNKSVVNSPTYVKDPGDRAQAEINRQNAQYTKQSLEQRRLQYTTRIATSNTNISQMENFINQATQTQDANTLTNIAQQFYLGSAGGTFGDTTKLAGLSTELIQMRIDMGQTNQLTSGQMQSCTNFLNTQGN